MYSFCMTELSLSIEGVTVKGGHVLFWHGPFSNWHIAPFVVNGQRYVCAEQWMMAEKARLFGDAERLAEILVTESPKAQKALGRKVTPFDAKRWSDAAEEIVVQGNLAKYRAHDDLRAMLLSTAPLPLAEASPFDRIWGIGLAPSHVDAGTPERWRGKNLLGKVLERVRDQLIQEAA
jgi:ribA/ribD-fused uncharacterized protein